MATSSSRYWAERMSSIVYGEEERAIRSAREMKAMYVDAYRSISNQMSLLEAKLRNVPEGLRTIELYRYGRYAAMEDLIASKYTDIGRRSVLGLRNLVERAYQATLEKSMSELGIPVHWGVFSEALMKAVIDTPWSGQHFSSRIWTNTENLASRIKGCVRDGISMGRSIDDMKRELLTYTDQGYSNVNRLVRTETMYTINQGQANAYREAGVEYYEFLAEIDDRTSSDCEDLDGQQFRLDEAMVGVNYPPLHPNCRSTVIPVVDLP